MEEELKLFSFRNVISNEHIQIYNAASEGL